LEAARAARRARVFSGSGGDLHAGMEDAGALRHGASAAEIARFSRHVHAQVRAPDHRRDAFAIARAGNNASGVARDASASLLTLRKPGRYKQRSA
jgi:hypothetical protein